MWHLLDRGVGVDPDAALAPLFGALDSDVEPYPCDRRVRQVGEHFEGADCIQCGHVVESDNRDVHLVSPWFGQAASARKRRRYSMGPVRSERRNTRRIVSAVPKPLAV